MNLKSAVSCPFAHVGDSRECGVPRVRLKMVRKHMSRTAAMQRDNLELVEPQTALVGCCRVEKNRLSHLHHIRTVETSGSVGAGPQLAETESAIGGELAFTSPRLRVNSSLISTHYLARFEGVRSEPCI